MTHTPPTPLEIDVVSDVVCPWCYVGKRKLEAALADAPEPVVVRWRPFQLDPTIPPGGLPRRAYMEKKFGDPARIEAIHATLVQAGREVGIAFDFDAIVTAPNTLDAHRVLRWAQTAGVQGAIKERLMALYFTAGADIGDRALLARVAGEAGMDEGVVARLLAGDDDVTAVRQEIATAVRLGVSGVPFFIFGGKFAVPGAQSREVLAAAMAKARSDPEPASELA